MSNNTTTMCVYVFASLLTISFLAYRVVTCNSGAEPFCNCQGAKTMVCPDKAHLQDLYVTGKLTENTDLAKLQKAQGLPKWSTRSFGEYDPKPSLRF